MYRIIGADGKEYGPVPAEQVRQWIAEGRANAATRIAREGGAEWYSLGALPEFSYLLQSHAAGPQFQIGPSRRNNPLAVAGMIMGILSLAFCLCCYGLPFNILGVIFSSFALVQIRNAPELYYGKSMAIAGLVLSLTSLLLGALFLVLGVASAWHPGKSPTYRL